VRDYDVDIMNLQRANEAGPAATGRLIEVELASGASLKARTVILSTGARWRQMGVPGEEEYRNKGVAYCPHCDGPLFKGKRVAVIGGGNSGVEAAIDLAGIVSPCHADRIRQPSCAPMRCCRRKLRSLPNVTVITSRRRPPRCCRRRREGDRPDLQGPRDRRVAPHRSGRHLRADRAAAEHRVAEGHVALSPRGEIVIDARGQTSCRACSPPAIAPPCPTSRSSSRWAKVRRRRCRPSTI
jgi:alkyl hydroperoxide reductase subunit F